MIKDENFYTVFGWMLNRLHLRGNDLKVYALIYSFSQDGESEYKGNLSFIEEFTGASGATIKRSLARLEAIKYIEKTERNSSTGGTNTYKIVPLDIVFAMLEGVGQNELPPQIKMSYGVGQNELGVGQNELRYINNNNNYKVSKKVSNKKRKIESYDEIFENFCTPNDLKKVVIEFIRYLKTSYKITVLNDRLETLLVKLDLKYRSDDLAKCNEVRRAITNGYKRLECEEVA